jgi:hypothetical protein
VFLPAALAALSLISAKPAPTFEIADGDRIVWIGNTLVEREQRYGYWEAALHVAFPDKQFTLRNLGWSGDTVFGDARGRFDFNNPDACFKQLVGLTLELKPTVIFVSYGTNESFEGEAGLPKFEKGLEKLLDALKPAKARVVLFTPMEFIEKTLVVNQPEQRNKLIQLYAKSIQNIAMHRGHSLAYMSVPLLFKVDEPISDNGMHLNERGYNEFTFLFMRALGLKSENIKSDQLDPLRKAIIAKNQLFFYRWRPQNETYLFGFRKHEQGKNAKEVAECDPLVAKAEEEIERIRKKLND